MIAKTKFTDFPLGKLSKNKQNSIDDQGRKQEGALQSVNYKPNLKSIKDLYPKNLLNAECKNEI